MIKQVLQQGFIISGSRLIALSMPMIDMMMLGRGSNENIANFTVANQMIQIFVILIISLSVGINILISKKQTRTQDVYSTIGYSSLIGLLLTVSALIIGYISLRENSAKDVYDILAIGLLPLAIFVAFSAILESKGFSKTVLIMTIFMSMANTLLNYLFINNLITPPSESVALSTKVLRHLFCAIIFFIAYKKVGIITKIKFSKKINLELFRFGKSEAITSFFFTGSIAYLFYHLSTITSGDDIANLGIIFNFINTAFILFVGFSISLTIYLSKKDYVCNEDIKSSFALSFLYMSVISFALCYFSEEIAYLYKGDITNSLSEDIKLSILIVGIDGLAISLISVLRVKGYAVLPPLFRLSFVIIGIPAALLTYSKYGNQGIILSLAFANAIALALTVFYLVQIVTNRFNHLKYKSFI